jgi:hypothetical protein
MRLMIRKNGRAGTIKRRDLRTGENPWNRISENDQPATTTKCSTREKLLTQLPAPSSAAVSREKPTNRSLA